MSKLILYSIFHLNLAYSSLREDQIKDVLQRCYWPLLKIAEDLDVKLGIEASAYTLEKIKEIDPTWLEKLKFLIEKGRCEFIGSGYAQIIGPLVPAEVNTHNLAIGNEIYESFLGSKPKIAYVNEQAFSRSLIAHYSQAGFEAIVMEWNNPSKFHKEWNRDWQYYPQIVVDNDGDSIKVIWNNSTTFQKFQRYATGEIERDEYLGYLLSHLSQSQRFLPIYGSDAEVFDFRTMRYQEEEAPITNLGEWQRIREAFVGLLENKDISFALPSEVLKKADGENAFNRISLESGEQPIPVKKRDTYNLTRWSLTSRDSIGVNTKCFQIYKNLIGSVGVDDSEKNKLWKDLCYLWSSDFRTHITEERFSKYKILLDKVLGLTKNFVQKNEQKEAVDETVSVDQKFVPVVSEKGRKISVETGCVKAVFNSQKGLVIESLLFKNIGSDWLIGTLSNGFFQDVSYADDFFSGHTVIEIPLRPKMVDLAPVRVLLPSVSANTGFIMLEADIEMGPGIKVHKRIDIFNKESRIDLKYIFDLSEKPPASFRSCVLTFNPKVFDRGSLYYACHNGGQKKEFFRLNEELRCGHLLSHLVSSRSALGNTKGDFEIGDKDKKIMITTDPAQIAALPMIQFEKVDKDNYFLRVYYSFGEFDETSLLSKEKKDVVIEFTASIVGKNNK